MKCLGNVALAALALVAPLVAATPTPAKDTYDYIVVGSGPGGGPVASILARHGHSVLLIEAGDDASDDPMTNIPALAVAARSDPRIHWEFFVRHYSDLDRQLKYHFLTWRLTDGSYWVGQNPPAGATLLGVYYPRGSTLGGSATLNNLIVFLPPDSDWQEIVDLTGDTAWSPKRMRKIFERVEHNDYLPRNTSGHGFDGFIHTINGAGDGYTFRAAPTLITVLKAMIATLGFDPEKFWTYLYDDLDSDAPNRDSTEGFWGLPFTADGRWRRSTGRDLILATANATTKNGKQKYPLQLQLSSLATKILFRDAKDCPGGIPQAYAVQYLAGASVYSADPRSNASTVASAVPRTAYARKEIIVSGGTFNSPQLLKLSGVGPAAELQALNIPVVADRPGVGANMMDNPELPVVGHAKQNFTTSDNSSAICTFGKPGDPCVALWEQGKGYYTEGQTNADALLRRTPYAPTPDRDMFMFSGNFAFRGFWPVTNQTNVTSDPRSTYGMSTIKMKNQNRAGTVRLRSADPRDTPLIDFNYFTDGGDIDLGAIQDTVKFARRAQQAVPAPLGPIAPTEPPCPAGSGPKPDGSCDDATDREWIMNQAFGHHPTSSCAIGADDDPTAVLDSKFRVRGVSGLRVVDASAFPRSPGAFPVVPTYMLSVQASDFILADAKA